MCSASHVFTFSSFCVASACNRAKRARASASPNDRVRRVWVPLWEGAGEITVEERVAGASLELLLTRALCAFEAAVPVRAKKSKTVSPGPWPRFIPACSPTSRVAPFPPVCTGSVGRNEGCSWAACSFRRALSLLSTCRWYDWARSTKGTSEARPPGRVRLVEAARETSFGWKVHSGTLVSAMRWANRSRCRAASAKRRLLGRDELAGRVGGTWGGVIGPVDLLLPSPFMLARLPLVGARL